MTAQVTTTRPTGAFRTPRPTVGMVVFNPADGTVLYGTKHGWNSDKKAYCDYHELPQGGIDPGENALQAAYRELREETGLTRDEVARIDQLDEPLPYTNHKGQVNMYWFLFQLKPGVSPQRANLHRASEKDEFIALKWATLHGVKTIIQIGGLKWDSYAPMAAEFGPLIAEITAQHTAAARQRAAQVEAMWRQRQLEQMAGGIQ
jgi:putative (di)nucleoside polyphosphate hydrolase